MAGKLPHIFENYYRSNEAIEHNKASTGLGLPLVRETTIAGKIGVRVESVPGRGATFRLLFPTPADFPQQPKLQEIDS